MKPRERIEAVLHHQLPDRVPFAPYIELVPTGEFERALRARGMGLWTFHTPAHWCERPHVGVETRVQGDVTTTVYHTPVGNVSTRIRTHLSRSTTPGRQVELEGLIKSAQDYEPVIFMIDDGIFHADPGVYEWAVRDLGDDGYVRIMGFDDPFMRAYSYFGWGTSDGLPNFVYHQRDYPAHFRRLVEALEHENERMAPHVLDCSAEVVCMGSVDGVYGPWEYEQYVLPFYQKWAPVFHSRGKLIYPHADSSRLKQFAPLMAQAGLDMVDAFTPPPIGNLSLAEAHAYWGNEMIIAVNFPETIFWQGPAATKQYALDLLRSCSGKNLIITMTEAALSVVADDPTARAFQDGMWAILDAIDEFAGEA